MKTRKRLLTLGFLIAAAPLALRAQMEKREGDLYDAANLRNAAPAVGTLAPDLVLSDLDGRPYALTAFKGRTVVLLKGGYT